MPLKYKNGTLLKSKDNYFLESLGHHRGFDWTFLLKSTGDVYWISDSRPAKFFWKGASSPNHIITPFVKVLDVPKCQRFEHSFNVKSMALRVDRDLTPKMSSPQVALDNRSRNIKIRRLLSWWFQDLMEIFWSSILYKKKGNFICYLWQLWVFLSRRGKKNTLLNNLNIPSETNSQRTHSLSSTLW